MTTDHTIDTTAMFRLDGQVSLIAKTFQLSASEPYVASTTLARVS